jgi:competence protein ComEC
MLLAPRPDLLITGDGKHLAVVEADGNVALLRAKAGDYIRDMLLENAGTTAEPKALEQWPGAECSADICVIEIKRGGQSWRVLATRTPYPVPTMEMAAACKRVDIVISERWLPSSCRPRWIKADRNMLEQSGGLAFYLTDQKLVSVNESNAHTPWVKAARDAKVRAELSQ